jgi:hypothetical protein
MVYIAWGPNLGTYLCWNFKLPTKLRQVYWLSWQLIVATACLVTTPILRSRALSSKDFLLDCVVGNNDSAPALNAAEIPLLLGLLGSLGDLLYSSVDVEIIAVGGRIRWRVKGGFLIG